MSKRNLWLVLILVMALGLSGCFSFLKSDKIETLTLVSSKETIGLADEDKTAELTVLAADKKENEIAVTLSSVEFDYNEDLAKIEIKDGKAILKALKAGTVKVTATYEKVTSNKVSIVITEGAAPIIKDALVAAIDEAETLLENTAKGSEPGQAPEDAHTALNDAVVAAKAVNDNNDATQAEVDAAVATLNTAIGIFEGAIVEADPVVVQQNFEEYEVGALDGSDFAFVVDDPVGEGTKALEIKCISNSAQNYEIDIKTLTKGRVSFLINKLADAGSFNVDLQGVSPRAGFQLTNGNEIRARVGGSTSSDTAVGSISIGEWARIEIDFDAEAGTISFYTGTGESRELLNSNDLDFPEDAEVNGIRFQHGGKDDKTASVYIDDIIVSDLSNK